MAPARGDQVALESAHLRQLMYRYDRQKRFRAQETTMESGREEQVALELAHVRQLM